MLNRQVAIETANQFISDLRTEGYNPQQAWLFGSTISGTPNEFSDIDLALWDKQFTGVLHLDVEKIKHILLRHKAIELHTYPLDVTETDDPFVSVIKSTGEQIL